MSKTKIHEVRAQLLKGIANGLSYKDACTVAGVSERVFYYWKLKAEEAKSGVYYQLFQDVKKANMYSKQKHFKNIENAAFGGDETIETRVEKDSVGNIVSTTITTKKAGRVWTASAWMLERRHPEEYGRNREVEIDNSQPLPWSDDVDPLGKY